MIDWAYMTNAEKAEMTIRDIKLRQQRKRVGIREANNFIFDNVNRAKKNRDKITAKKYRQRW